jgi:hypothetical protein
MSRRTDVPQRDAIFFEQAKAVFIRQVGGSSGKLSHDAPEGVLWLGIILATLQRDLSGQ